MELIRNDVVTINLVNEEIDIFYDILTKLMKNHIGFSNKVINIQEKEFLKNMYDFLSEQLPEETPKEQ